MCVRHCHTSFKLLMSPGGRTHLVWMGLQGLLCRGNDACRSLAHLGRRFGEEKRVQRGGQRRSVYLPNPPTSSKGCPYCYLSKKLVFNILCSSKYPCSLDLSKLYWWNGGETYFYRLSCLWNLTSMKKDSSWPTKTLFNRLNFLIAFFFLLLRNY